MQKSVILKKWLYYVIQKKVLYCTNSKFEKLELIETQANKTNLDFMNAYPDNKYKICMFV